MKLTNNVYIFTLAASKGGHDIALIKLQTVNGKGIVFGSSVQPICLPTSEEVYKPGTWCSVSGWGMQKGTILSYNLSITNFALAITNF